MCLCGFNRKSMYMPQALVCIYILVKLIYYIRFMLYNLNYLDG